MAPRPLRQAAWIAPATCAVLLVAGLVAKAAAGTPWQADRLVNVPLSLGFALVGGLIVSRHPRHLLGWLHLGAAAAMALTVAVNQYAVFGLADGLPLTRAAGWVAGWIWALGFAPLFTFGLLLFPDGRLPSRRWRPAAVVSGAGLLCLVLPPAFAPGPLTNHPEIGNPLGIPAAGPLLGVLDAVGFPLVLAGFAAGVAALATRWWQGEAGGLARRQLSLLVVAAVLSFGLVAAVPDSAGMPRVLGAASLVLLTLVPAAIGVAILRHRLYDIDVVLNRTLVFGGLTAAIGVLYAGVVWALGRPLPAQGYAGAVAIGLIGALLLPLRAALQRLVDRAMYGDRGDPYAALSRLSSRLQAAAAPGAALPAVAEAIRDSLRLPSVVLEATTGEQACAGTPAGGPAESLPLEHQGREVGRLVVEGRDRRPLGPRDLRLLTELARTAGAAVSAAALADALGASRARLVQAREEERRRLRRDLHDGLGPTLAGIGLGLDLAAGEPDQDAAARMLAELRKETTAAVEDVRRLVDGLRPPALDELGLVSAIRQQVDRLAVRSPGLTVTVRCSGPLPPLSAATEVAAYRIAVEAVTNTVRHAAARTCSVEVAVDGVLRVVVTDDGRGPGQPTTPGVGLTAMAERAAEVGGTCAVTPAGPRGTTVLAELPVEAP